MRPTLIALFVFLLLTAAAAQVAQTPPPPNPSAPARQTVTMLFTATDRKGNPIAAITKDDVAVVDNNQPAQTVEVRSASELPLRLGIVLLASKKNFSQQQAAAIDLLQKLDFRSDIDKAFVVTAGGDKPWPQPRLTWQTDRAALVQTIRGLDKSTGVPDAFNFNLSTDQTSQTRLTIQSRATIGPSVFDVIWAMLNADRTPARRAIVMVRDPAAHSPGFVLSDATIVEQSHTRIITNAQILGVSFLMIGLEDSRPPSNNGLPDISGTYAPTHAGQGGGLRVYDEGLARAREHAYSGGVDNLQRLADETGGHVWSSSKKNYSDAVIGIVNHLKAQYAVTFVPSGLPAAGTPRALRLQLKGKDANASAAKAYYVPEKSAQ